ncbi:septum formation family protein [Isoptericola variabilis]|uniref:Septum formation-related domain-containing protein n=1 Tax=Isoptericola variabilis (strain 225) TaxID=743718 RepID=F6FTW2_ISOV2|nr:septum formation family protein [Isoptericola variabilis]AEG45333.1 hypothetical protein Isova_2630 [Isoptericola variabilis 225]TWH34836.1 putative regulator of septum formation [Isoptericola variabilis J7]
MSTSRPRALRALAALVAAPIALALAGCGAVDGLLGPGDPERDENGEVTTAADADIFSVTLGDCLDTAAMDPDAEEFMSLPVVPCSEPHTGEVDAETTLSDADHPDGFPGDEAIAEEADAFCLERFELFVGLAYEDSALDFWQFWPTEESWAEGDRLVQCVVESLEPVTGTLEGSGL